MGYKYVTMTCTISISPFSNIKGVPQNMREA